MLVPFVLGATVLFSVVLTGCRDEKNPSATPVEPPVEASHPPALERVNDPAYRAAMTNEVAVRKELLRMRSGLERKLEAARAAGDAAEAKSLEGRIAEVNVAIDDVRRRMLKTIRTYMTNSVGRVVK